MPKLSTVSFLYIPQDQEIVCGTELIVSREQDAYGITITMNPPLKRQSAPCREIKSTEQCLQDTTGKAPLRMINPERRWVTAPV